MVSSFVSWVSPVKNRSAFADVPSYLPLVSSSFMWATHGGPTKGPCAAAERPERAKGRLSHDAGETR